MLNSPKQDKSNTVRPRKPLLDLLTVRAIKRTRDMTKNIAKLARCSDQYVSQVVGRRRPPSEKLLDAIQVALIRDARQNELAAFMARYGGRR